VIKALNEQAHIEACLSSALRALQGIGGEVVLADSCSSDATVALARRYPVRIVQLAHASERCCGIGAQLGYEHARGSLVYLMDGDMELQEGFLQAAASVLAQNPQLAAVGGQVLERNLAHLEYRARNDKPMAQRRSAAVDRLDGGGLYRRAAIESVAYLSDRNLHSYEEYELGLRLRRAGWGLWRLPIDAVSHEGHRTAALALLWRRWRSGYAWGAGELLRACWGDRLRWLEVWRLREMRLYLGLLAMWLLLGAWLLASWPHPLPALAAAALSACAVLLLTSWRKRSLTRGLYALLAWHVNAAGLLRGLLRKRRSPSRPIASRMIQDAPSCAPSGVASCAPSWPAPPGRPNEPQPSHVLV
jgi:GT2 family glycosyltransferase